MSISYSLLIEIINKIEVLDFILRSTRILFTATHPCYQYDVVLRVGVFLISLCDL